MATDLYKTKRNLAAAIIHEFFEQRNIQQYYLRSQTDFQLGSAKTVNYRLRTLRYLDPQIWNIVPLEVKIQIRLNNSRQKLNLGTLHCVKSVRIRS